MKTGILPFEDRVLLQKLDPEAVSPGGIIIPDVGKEPSQIAIVIAVGPGKKDRDGQLIPMLVALGDKVWVGKYSGANVTLNGEEYVMMRQADMLGKVINE